jgi:tetratricopeptide (TPR) repeat protein
LGWLLFFNPRGQFEESLVLFDRMAARDANDAEVLYARGEVHRLRDEAGDEDRSLADFRRCVALPKTPAQAWRSMGLVQRRRGEAADAAASFDKYLALAPEAADAGLIRSYVAEMKP